MVFSLEPLAPRPLESFKPKVLQEVFKQNNSNLLKILTNLYTRYRNL